VRIERFPIAHVPPNRFGFRALHRLRAELDRLPATTPLVRGLSAFTPPVPGLASALREGPGRFDVVHGMNLTIEGPLLAALSHAREADVPFLVSPLIHLGESERSVVRRYYTMRHQIELVRRADVVFAQTDTEVDYLVGRGIPRERLVVVGPGVDVAQAAGGDAEAGRRWLGVDGPIVCSLGAMAYDKGTFHVVEAMERLWADGSDATLVLAGERMEQLDRFLAGRRESTRQRTRVLGYVTDEQRRNLLAAASAMAMPSRTDSFGIAYMDAWLNGCPVIGAAAGGVPSVVEDGRSGLIVPFGDVPALANAIDRLLADRDLGERMAAAGAARVRQHHTWDHVYDRVRPWFSATKRSAA
jgi:glycosyltransferase involved in cell wall biosynthesis